MKFFSIIALTFPIGCFVPDNSMVPENSLTLAINNRDLNSEFVFDEYLVINGMLSASAMLQQRVFFA